MRQNLKLISTHEVKHLANCSVLSVNEKSFKRIDNFLYKILFFYVLKGGDRNKTAVGLKV